MSISDRGQTERERECEGEPERERYGEGCWEPFCWNVQRWREAICCITTTCRREREVKELSVVPQVMISLRLDWNKCARYSATLTSICYWTLWTGDGNGSQNGTRTHSDWKMTASQRNILLLGGCFSVMFSTCSIDFVLDYLGWNKNSKQMMVVDMVRVSK